MSEEQRRQLQQQLGNIANTLRGKMPLKQIVYGAIVSLIQ
jgi:hypothetical protein